MWGEELKNATQTHNPVNIDMKAPHGANVGHLVGPMWATHVGPTLFCPWANGGAHVGWPTWALDGHEVGPVWASYYWPSWALGGQEVGPMWASY